MSNFVFFSPSEDTPV